MVIHLNEHRRLQSSVGLGDGSNNYVELLAFNFLLYWLTHLGIHSVQIFKDLMNIIKWFNDKSICEKYILSPFLEEAKYLKQNFNDIKICHIYREWNSAANQLSKVGIQQDLDCWRIEEIELNEIHVSDQPPFLY